MKGKLCKVDMVCGGFPCQDVSKANYKGCGLDGKSSGLWSEMFEVVRELRPRFVLVENVAALANNGLSRVLWDLASSGYDAQWEVLPAYLFGAPQRRRRLFVIAYSDCKRKLCEIDLFQEIRRRARDSCRWPPEPNLSRVVHGLPERMDRERVLANSVIPRTIQIIGEALREFIN